MRLRWIVLALLTVAAGAATPSRAASATLTIDADQIVRRFDHRRLIGSNVALWNGPECYRDPEAQWLREMAPGIMRMPGGSWSDIVFWNGNGVRTADGRVDQTRVRDGYPLVDYSAYARSIVWMPEKGMPAEWGGHVDVKTQHEFVRSIPNCDTLVTVNAGTGRAIDAAEWVRWANLTQHYGVRYWEIGNELEGGWEAGHFLPGGGEMTGDLYAARFAEFARAMKAVDPSIKIGGAAGGGDSTGFSEQMLRDAGQDVDFVSFHTYPCQPGQSEAEMLARTQGVGEAVARLRGWIRKYQPDRVDRIEIGVTEWNLASSREGSDLFSALWSSISLGQMATSGVDFANQWDALSQGTGEDGAALLLTSTPPVRKAQYWAFWLWSRYMQDALLRVEAESPSSLYSLATRSDDAVALMLVNTSPEEEANVTVRLRGVRLAIAGTTSVLSPREYFWDPFARRVQWSSAPQPEPIRVGAQFSVSVPPHSLRYLRLPLADHPEPEVDTPSYPGIRPELHVLLPAQAYADAPVEGWVQALRAGTTWPLPSTQEPATLHVTGPATADRKTARLAESAGRFFLQPQGEGPVTVTATLGDLSATGTVELIPSVPQPRVFWRFEEGSLAQGKGVESAWPMSIDTSARPNRSVLRVDLAAAPSEQHNPAVLRLSSFPDRTALKRENIRGVVFDLAASRDLHCNDSDAHLEIVMQSQGNYWMSLGRLPLRDVNAEWQTHTFRVTDPKHIEAMPWAFNVWLILRANQPVQGALFVDNVGLLVR